MNQVDWICAMPKLPNAVKLLTLVGIQIAITSCAAYAQFSNGSIVVTVPQPKTSKATRPAKQAPKKVTRPARKQAARKVRRPKRKQAPARATSASRLKIAVLVNDDPITQYEVEQRARLLASRAGVGKQAQTIFRGMIRQKATNQRLRQILRQTIEANRGKSREAILAIFERKKRAFGVALQRQAMARARAGMLPRFRKRAVEELIDERLKIQAAKSAKVLATDAEVDRVLGTIAKRNKLSVAGFKKQLKRNGTDVNSMRQRIRASMSWFRLVGAKFGRYIDVNQKTIDESVASAGPGAVSLHLHRLVLTLPKKLDQSAVARRMAEAESVRARFSGCDGTRRLTGSGKGILFNDLGFTIATAVPEPTRTLLLTAKTNEMLPPVTTNNGVTLYAVCGRRAGASSFKARDAAVRAIRQRGVEVYSRKYIADLRRDAHIEYR